jgi:hypothetical protein
MMLPILNRLPFLALLISLASVPAYGDGDRAQFDHAEPDTALPLASSALATAGGLVGAAYNGQKATGEMALKDSWDHAYLGGDEKIRKIDSDLAELEKKMEPSTYNPENLRHRQEALDGQKSELARLKEDLNKISLDEIPKNVHPDMRVEAFWDKYALPEEKAIRELAGDTWYPENPASNLIDLRTRNFDELAEEIVMRKLEVEQRSMFSHENALDIMKSAEARDELSKVRSALGKVYAAQTAAGVRGRLGLVNLDHMARLENSIRYEEEFLKNLSPDPALSPELAAKKAELLAERAKTLGEKEFASKEYEAALKRMLSANRWAKVNAFVAGAGAVVTAEQLYQIFGQKGTLEPLDSAVAGERGIRAKKADGPVTEPAPAAPAETPTAKTGI